MKISSEKGLEVWRDSIFSNGLWRTLCRQHHRWKNRHRKNCRSQNADWRIKQGVGNTHKKKKESWYEAIFYKEESLRAIGKKEKVSYQAIGKRRDKILEKLRKLLEDKF